MTIDEWRHGWQVEGAGESVRPWKLGDLFNAGREFIEDKSLAGAELAKAIAKLIPKIDSSGLKVATLREWGQVAAAFSPKERRSGVSFYHHREVWASGSAVTSQWLADAEAGGWSVRDLRVKLAEAKGGGEAKEAAGRLKPPFILVQWADAGAAGLRKLFPDPPSEKVRATARVEVAALLAEFMRVGIL